MLVDWPYPVAYRRCDVVQSSSNVILILNRNSLLVSVCLLRSAGLLVRVSVNVCTCVCVRVCVCGPAMVRLPSLITDRGVCGCGEYGPWIVVAAISVPSTSMFAAALVQERSRTRRIFEASAIVAMHSARVQLSRRQFQ